MKKALTGVFTAIMVVSIGTITALAAGPGAGHCRYHGDGAASGICSFHGEYCRFVDEDQDGVCDNFGSCSNYSGRGTGHGCGRHGHGCGFRGGCSR